MADMLGMGDLSPFAEDDTELREADRLDRSVPFAPSSVPTVDVVAPARHTHLRFVSSRRRGVTMQSDNLLYERYINCYCLRSSQFEISICIINLMCDDFFLQTVPDHLERRFTDVISAVEALQEEVRSSDRERKESDSVRDEQHKELVCMIQTLQGTST
ncbi:hypothetical protein LWI29_015047 [Acer saccharum]|uniref:Uncharacterized protein n=1 Tax=Acer saccharum TaxID=4024 RepID=A0AA39VB30_ACESA|nr:hypothetical protein LWI29_015047 [Acer saccharum]